MKKDILFPKVEGVFIAITQKIVENDEKIFEVYLINKNQYPLQNVFVTSNGYGVLDTNEVKTSTLRHFLGDIEADSALLIEPLDGSVLAINNEYWLSFFHNNQLFDKKYIFIAGSFIEEHLVYLPELKLKGLLHP